MARLVPKAPTPSELLALDLGSIQLDSVALLLHEKTKQGEGRLEVPFVRGMIRAWFTLSDDKETVYIDILWPEARATGARGSPCRLFVLRGSKSSEELQEVESPNSEYQRFSWAPPPPRDLLESIDRVPEDRLYLLVLEPDRKSEPKKERRRS